MEDVICFPIGRQPSHREDMSLKPGCIFVHGERPMRVYNLCGRNEKENCSYKEVSFFILDSSEKFETPWTVLRKNEG